MTSKTRWCLSGRRCLLVLLATTIFVCSLRTSYATKIVEEECDSEEGGKNSWQENLKKLLFDNNNPKDDVNDKMKAWDIPESELNAWEEGWNNVGKFLTAFLSDDEESNEQAVTDLLSKAQSFASSSGSKSQRSLTEMWTLFGSYLSLANESVTRFLDSLNQGEVSLPALYYMIEYEDSKKHPSWKRRKHRFHKLVNVKKLNPWYQDLYLANIAYMDTREQIENELDVTPWEIVDAYMDSAPGEPSHFIAMRKGHDEEENKSWFQTSYLDILITVRGTKQLGDVLSDVIHDIVDFRGGKAHKGIVEAGQHLVDKHIALLEKLLKESKREKIRLHIVGHSLGGGAASIAAMIFNQDYKSIIEATAMGFGTPAVLSKELSEETRPYITTVVADSDIVPRLSGSTITNVLLDIVSHDWTYLILEDLKVFLRSVQKDVPLLLPNDLIDNIINFANDSLKKSVKIISKSDVEAKQMKVELIPPGECIHFFRDGSGVTATHTPCDFFDSIDVTRNMIDDHLIPFGYNKLFLEMIRGHKKDLYFSFDEKIYDPFDIIKTILNF